MVIIPSLHVSERWGRSCLHVVGFLATLSGGGVLCGEVFRVEASRFFKGFGIMMSRKTKIST